MLVSYEGVGADDGAHGDDDADAGVLFSLFGAQNKTRLAWLHALPHGVR